MFINPEQTVIKTSNVRLVWDGISQPEQRDDGKYKRHLAVLIPSNVAEVNELKQLIQKEVNENPDIFHGQMPTGDNYPLRDPDVAKLGPEAQGHLKFTASTTSGIPTLFDENGQQLDPQAWTQIAYPGLELQLLVDSYPYNHKGKTGVSFGLQGVMVVNRNAAKFDVGGGMSASEVANAFNVGSGAQQQPAAPQQQQPTAAAAPPPTQQTTAAPPPPPPANDLAEGKIMTDAATTTYNEYIKSGWTDEMLIQHGLMVPQ